MKRTNYIYILSILVLSLVIFNWFKGDAYIYGGDTVPIFHAPTEFKEDCFLWSSYAGDGLGSTTRSVPEIFPWEAFAALVSSLGFSAVTGEKIVFYLVMVISGLSMFLFVMRTFRRMRHIRLGALIAAQFYMFNTYTLFFKWPDRFQSLFVYMLLPLLLSSYIEGIRENGNWRKAFIIGIVSVCMAPAATTPTYIALAIIPLLFFYAFYNIVHHSMLSLKSSTIFSLKSGVALLVLNLWWILPYIYIVGQSVHKEFEVARGINSFHNTFEINSKETSLLNIFRLMGYWALNSGYQGYPYFPNLSRVYSSPFFLLISTCIPLMAFASCSVKGLDAHIKQSIVFFALLALLSMIFIKGTHAPFGAANTWLFFHFPGFAMFRSQYEKLGNLLTLSYSALLCVAISGIYSWFKKRLQTGASMAVVGAILLMIFINAFPFFTGTHIHNARGPLKGNRLRVPEYYHEANQWIQDRLRHQVGNRLLYYPPSAGENGKISHYWGYTSSTVLSRLLGRPVIVGTALDKNQKHKLENAPRGILRLGGVFDASYVILDYSRDRVDILRELGKLKHAKYSAGFECVRRFGKLEICRIEGLSVAGKIYATQEQ